ncbi:bb0ac4ad-e33b-4ba6-a2c4-68c2fc5d54b3 [Sclerotinia trifoliorum]|uniref:Bb0ac4ad-e33b-4ba6-a2c4-68c2fc5d54b3 n=1 Tax=Sclerotinia trifoliorum TaxID=28548 RepID=A0A8H2W3A0_9HELO|nr:bb0ac4ad-e33b-4ba6-a2c4-68c2fc5d54b3 [Sclerotinia trifoliorum]
MGSVKELFEVPVNRAKFVSQNPARKPRHVEGSGWISSKMMKMTVIAKIARLGPVMMIVIVIATMILELVAGKCQRLSNDGEINNRVVNDLEKRKVIEENESEEEYQDESLEEKDDNDDDEEDEDRNYKRKNKKSKSKQNAKENSKKRVKAKTHPKSKVKKLVEDDKIALLGTENVENDDEGNDSEDEDEHGDTSKIQESEIKRTAKGNETEKPNPYRWTNPSPIFDKNKGSIYQRARAKGSDRESIRQLEIQHHRKRRERASSSKKPKISISKDTSDDGWTDTDASSLATSKRSGSTSSRLSSLFGPRNRSLTPEPTSHLMSPISPLTRPSISSRTGETTFGATVIRASPLQEIVSADSLPANPEPNDTIITPLPAVHQRALLPLPKTSDPCMEGMKKVIFMSRGKRSSIKLVPSDGKPTDPDDVEIILTK